MGTKLLEVDIGRDFGAPKGLTLFQLEPFWGTYLLEVSIGRDFGAGALHYWEPFFGTNLLEVSIGRDLGFSKGVCLLLGLQIDGR